MACRIFDFVVGDFELSSNLDIAQDQIMKRRDFLVLSASGIVALPSYAVLAAAEPVVLTAAATSQQLLPTKYGGPTNVLGFNGSVPGPTLRAVQNTPFTVRLDNNLAQDTAVHWHGVRLANAMDGVPGLTQSAVSPGDSFYYEFVPPDAGTYWYHSHFLSNEQVARGLMGPLVVEENTPPDVDHDIVAMFADWRLQEDGTMAEGFGNMHDMAHAGRMGNFARVFLPETELRTGQRIRLRLINGAVDRIFPLILKGLSGKIVALDGMPLREPRDWNMPVLAPAQRVDIIADVTGPVELEMDHRQGAYPLGGLEVSGSVAPRQSSIPTLPPNQVSTPGDPARTLRLVMGGGAMGGQHGGDDIWSFNDVSGMTDAPFAEVTRGETVRIQIVNDTSFPHGIHLHGHHFYELAADGTPGDLRDTTLVDPGTSRDILCLFDNPGKWMLHCHMLSHQARGMKTWVQVT